MQDKLLKNVIIRISTLIFIEDICNKYVCFHLIFEKEKNQYIFKFNLKKYIYKPKL